MAKRLTSKVSDIETQTPQLTQSKQSKMTEEEKLQWDNLYRYIKKDIFNYDNNQSLPKDLVLRLKGLKDGKFMANKSIVKTAEYSFDIILYTFKFCKNNILFSLQTKNFANESNKVNYIMKIIENNINDVYIRINNAKKSQDKIETIKTDTIEHKGAIYTTKSKVNTSKSLENLW